MKAEKRRTTPLAHMKLVDVSGLHLDVDHKTIVDRGDPDDRLARRDDTTIKFDPTDLPIKGRCLGIDLNPN
ncbi:hypothetical protein D9M69_02990 [compost metagenome]